MMVDIDSEELKDYVSAVVNRVKSGLNEQGYAVAGAIEFELVVVNVKKKGAGIRILVVDASAQYDKEVVSKIKFYASPKGSKLERAFR